MTIKTTLSFTDRHHRFLTDKVGQGVFASQSAAVAAALEQMMRDEEERELALGAKSGHGSTRRAPIMSRPRTRFPLRGPGCRLRARSELSHTVPSGGCG